MARIHAVRQIIPTILNGPLGKALEAYFGSYFRLMSLSLVRGFPGETQGSFMWHRDFEPPQQTHLMIYLTDSSETTGGTSFLNLEETKIAAESGIHYQPDDIDRPDTIEKMEEKVGRKLHPYRPDLKAGDGILFGAPRILHQGNLPKEGWRDTLMMLFLPSPVPWDEFLAKDTKKFFVTRHPGASFIEPFSGQILPSRTHDVLEWAAMGEMFPPEYQG